MRVFSAEDIDGTLDFPSLIDARAEAMRGGFVAPRRHHHEIERAGEATAPPIEGQWLRGGQHLDLVGAFTMRMREVDDAALKRARIFIDTDAALDEGGDVAIGLRDGAITRADIVAGLPALCRGAGGRMTRDEITAFKSVGAAIEDLGAAILVWRKAGGAAP